MALVSTAAALAAQISAVPAWALARRRRRQVSPPPVTFENVCAPPADGPSEVMKASRSSPGAVVEKAGEMIVLAALVWWVVTVLSTARLAPAEVGTNASTMPTQSAARQRFLLGCRRVTDVLVPNQSVL